VGREQDVAAQQDNARSDGQGDADVIRLGLIAAPDLPEELARDLAGELPDVLSERLSDAVEWEVPVVTDALGANERVSGSEIVDRARERMQQEGWDFAICITDVPLRIGRRPIVADASAIHGVGLICLPALGAVNLKRRTRDAIVHLVDGLLGESMARGVRDRPDGGNRRRRVGRALRERAAIVRRLVPEDDGGDIEYVAAVVRGNLRLLVGMVRANRPWRMIAGLYYVLAAALGGVAFALVTSDVSRIADSLSWWRLVVLMVGSMLATVVSLIAAHDLWERPVDGRSREQAILFNVATTATVMLGVVCLYVTLFVVALASAGLVLTTGYLSQAVSHQATLSDYMQLAWMLSSLATVGGALGAGLEDDTAVRHAAYGYRPDAETRSQGPCREARGRGGESRGDRNRAAAT
jgi:hypothetical protein